jgi:hypothetical protein
VVVRPAYSEHEHQIDEDILREELEESVNYSRPQQISRDVDSLSAIMRLRQGKRPFRLEESRALFVTTNSALVGVAQRHFSDGLEASGVPPCLTDYALTNILWLKRPTAAPHLPRMRIIADCYAATRPTERLWQLYLQEIDKLRQRSKVTSDEYYMLRNSTAAESTLMEVTMGEEEGFTQGTVPEILERVRSDLEARKQAEVDAERASREAIEHELKAMREWNVHRRAQINARARRYASKAMWGVKFSLLIVLALATLLSFGWGLPLIDVPGERYVTPGTLFILFIFSLASFWNGTTVEGVARRLEVALARSIEQKLLTMTEE